MCFEVVPRTSKWWTITDILWERVPGGVGAEIRKARKPWLWRGTVSCLAEEERMVRWGMYLWRRFARYRGRPEPRALNVIVESLKLIRESIGCQCRCRSSAVVDRIGNDEFWGTVILARALCTRSSRERYFNGQPNRIETIIELA